MWVDPLRLQSRCPNTMNYRQNYAFEDICGKELRGAATIRRDDSAALVVLEVFEAFLVKAGFELRMEAAWTRQRYNQTFKC